MFNIGDKVTDRTAVLHNWPDKYAVVIDVDGAHIKVRYQSGFISWKKYINLQHGWIGCEEGMENNGMD
jgi:hypothetical protein